MYNQKSSCVCRETRRLTTTFEPLFMVRISEMPVGVSTCWLKEKRWHVHAVQLPKLCLVELVQFYMQFVNLWEFFLFKNKNMLKRNHFCFHWKQTDEYDCKWYLRENWFAMLRCFGVTCLDKCYFGKWLKGKMLAYDTMGPL